MATIDEKELEDFLMEPGNLQHIEMYTDAAYVTRQMNLGQYGIADIVAIQPCNREHHGCDYLITVVELKKDEVNVATLMQACRYVAALKQFIAQCSRIQNPIIESFVVLVGRTLCVNDWTFIGHQLQHVRAWTYSLSLEEGVSFEDHELDSYLFQNAQAPAGFASKFTELIEFKKLEIDDYYQKKSSEAKAKQIPAPELTAEKNTDG